MKTRERDQVDRKLSEVRVQLTGESQAACHTAHGCRDQVVQVTNCKTKRHRR
ncbi:hypothetical protein HanRHA438_Chr06g0284351 [Helianthus annuus]|nr:hypothetical protein HanRHA438_Chr06g0284351 [Helianthus annuus]